MNNFRTGWIHFYPGHSQKVFINLCFVPRNLCCLETCHQKMVYRSTSVEEVRLERRGRIHMSWHHPLGGFSIWRQPSNIDGATPFPCCHKIGQRGGRGRERLPLMTFLHHFSPAFICLAASKPWRAQFHPNQAYTLQGATRRLRPGFVNASGKLRQKW